MATLWDRTATKSLALKNRVFTVATWEGLATCDGECNHQLVAFASRLAKGNLASLR